MTPYRLALLALAALLATGGAFWLSSQRHLERAVRTGDALLPQLRGAINEVAEVRVGRGDGAQVTLQRGADGWTVVERGYRAESGKVRKLLLDLAALEIVEEKTHDPARYPVLGVEDVATATATGTRIDVKLGSGAIQRVIIGKGSGSRESYVRVAAAKPSYLARPQIAAEANPSRWLDTDLVDLDADRIRAVTFEKPGRPPRTLEGAALTPALAGALRGLALEDLRGKPLDDAGREAAGAAPQRARYLAWNGLSLVIDGREDGSRRWIALSASADPAAARARPAAGTAAAAAPSPAAAPPQPGTEAELLSRRFADREFEIPAYRYAILFDADSAAP